MSSNEHRFWRNRYWTVRQERGAAPTIRPAFWSCHVPLACARDHIATLREAIAVGTAWDEQSSDWLPQGADYA